MKNLKIEQIETQDLHFDYKNPRLAEFGLTSQTRDDEMLQILWEAMSVKELVLSIAASGFFQHEPLIVTKEFYRKANALIVIEGNRRLAAVKTILQFLNPQKGDDNNIDLSGIKLNKAILNELKTLPCIVVSSRRDAWQFIGFKHINGPAKWGSFAKAQYISQIHKEFGIPLDEIAEQIGDTHNTVQKLYQGLMILEQAEKAKAYDRTDVKANRLYFSHLYTAIGYDGVRNFLGLKEQSAETDKPVDETKIEDLGRFLIWLFGSRKYKLEPEVKSQNPDLRNLDAVLKNEESKRALKSGKPLMIAYEISKPVIDTFLISLSEIKLGLQKAQSVLAVAYDGSLGPLQTAGTILKQSRLLYENMLQKNKEKLDIAEEIISEDE